MDDLLMVNRIRTRWSAEKVACLERLWKLGAARTEMVQALEMVWPTIERKAIELGLGEPPAKRNGDPFRRGRSLGVDIRHRASLGLENPIELKPGRSLFGATIKAIDSDTRALIDAALAKRASA